MFIYIQIFRHSYRQILIDEEEDMRVRAALTATRRTRPPALSATLPAWTTLHQQTENATSRGERGGDPKPKTRDTKQETRNLKHEARDRKPETRNPKPGNLNHDA